MWDYCPSPKSSKLAMLDKNLPVTGNPWGCMHTVQLHCVQKNVTTSSAITLTKSVRLQQFLVHLLLRVLAIDRCFYFSTLPISCTYFNLGKLSNLQQNLKKWKFHRKMQFWFKISIKAVWCTKDAKWISWQRLESWKHWQSAEENPQDGYIVRQTAGDRTFVA